MYYTDEYADWLAQTIQEGQEDDQRLREIEATEIADSIAHELETCECSIIRTEETELGAWYRVCEDCGHSTLMPR